MAKLTPGLEWKLCTGRCTLSKPKPTRWTDDLIKVTGTHWMREARNQSLCRHLKETYVHQWTSYYDGSWYECSRN